MTETKKDKNHSKQDKIKPSGKNKYIALGVIAAIVAVVSYVIYSTDNTIDSRFPSIDGIPCETQEYSTFHIHAHMDIFVSDQHIGIPAQIGITNSCLYWLHTHTPDGIIHIESPAEREFTIGQFLDIWKSTSKTLSIPDNEPEIFINGNLVSTKLNNTAMSAHDEIVLVYGNVPQNMPSFYQFPEGL
ncbi:hypothetical protein [Candidatus Nitrosotalea bavarica]|uniref:hypothetical protein n=1 Tax=Candidatus Nitrosotalea bavarica TaxID=1903277 RepID=UPI000C703390|nr:hypothetical protein [Candidatus Nitrosotalea bavarica]